LWVFCGLFALVASPAPLLALSGAALQTTEVGKEVWAWLTQASL
jgi:hypothetical protein